MCIGVTYIVAELWEKQEMAAILDAILDFGKSSSNFIGSSVFENLWISILLGSLCLKKYI